MRQLVVLRRLFRIVALVLVLLLFPRSVPYMARLLRVWRRRSHLPAGPPLSRLLTAESPLTSSQLLPKTPCWQMHTPHSTAAPPAAPLTFRPYMSPFRLQTTALPKFGIEKEVRVCDTCHDKNAGPGNKPDAALPLPGAGGAVSEMEKMRQLALDNQDLSPEEEVRRALAAERANPTQRSPQVGRANPPGGAAGGDAAARAQEDEELQLALALSMSEEEARKSQPSARSRYPPAASTYNPPPVAPQSSSMYNFDDNLLDDDPMARYMSIARQLGESREGRRSARSPRSFPVYSLSFAILCLLYRHS